MCYYWPIMIGDPKWWECVEQGSGAKCHGILFFRAISWVGCLYEIAYTELIELIRVGFRQYVRSFWNWLNLCMYLSVLGSIASEFLPSQQFLRKCLLAPVALSLWVSLLPFLQLNETCGLLIVMMTKMVKDVRRFLVLYAVFIVGYSGAFYELLQGQSGYESFVNAFISTFLMMFASFDYSLFKSLWGLQWLVGNLLFVSHLIIAVVVLLNILIAMISTTYADIWVAAEAEKLFTQASTIVQIEMTMKTSTRKKYFARLLPCDPKADARPRQRGLRSMATVRPVERFSSEDAFESGLLVKLKPLEDGIRLKRDRYATRARSHEKMIGKLHGQVAQLTETILQLQSTVDVLSQGLSASERTSRRSACERCSQLAEIKES
ncbi:hypothetical protein PINS_up016554 [Pythium insidiosum]|nr:hypothetical protein PINS_up016554 [Pythium insidiosum]